MANELEQKFVFVLGSANKAKRLPHMAALKKQRDNGSQPEELPQTDTSFPASPAPVDVLDILQALSSKVDNLRNKIRYVEQLETPPSITTTTKIVETITQIQIDIAALVLGQKQLNVEQQTHKRPHHHTHASNPTLNLIDLTEPSLQPPEDHPMGIIEDPPSSSGQISKATAPPA
jgi:hypothetical protein